MRKFNLSLFFLLLSCLLITGNVEAQVIPSDLSTINIDDLTDEQVQQFLSRVEQSGLSEQQLEVMARARGMSPSQISKLRARILAIQSDTKEDTKTQVNRLRDEMIVKDSEDLLMFEDLLPEEEIIEEEESQIFGMDLFRSSELTFEPSLNIPTPEDFVIGPGDEIIIDIWGASEQTFQLQVSPEGYIRVPNLGPIYINGLSIAKARRRIKSSLSRIYNGLKPTQGGSPNTFSQVTLGNIRSIKVNVIGEVVQPGTYTVSSLATVFNALYYAGGPTDNGTMRIIDVFRAGKKVAELDIYEYLISGDHSENIRLNSDDIINVRPYAKRITLSGEVKRPGVYESKGSESVGLFLNFAGGFNEHAYQAAITIRRNEEREMSILTVKSEKFDSFELQSGDNIEVGRINSRYSNRVKIQGAVYREGDYELKEGMTLSGLIKTADGLRGDAFLGRGIILRTLDDFSLVTIEFNPGQVAEQAQDIALQKNDQIIISSIHDLKEEQTIQIEGEVSNPGKFPYSDGMTVEDIIYLAGGMKESASGSNIEVARRKDRENQDLSNSAEIFTFDINVDLNLNNQTSNFQLQPFDLVLIRKSPGYEDQSLVEIEGEVLYPGKYSIEKKNERISDIINRAKGITQFAYLDGATLIRKTEFFADEQDADKAAKLRRESLEDLGERDSTLVNIEIKTQESIGINLKEILKNPGSKYDLILQEHDVISIPKQLQTIRMRGELLYPSTVRYDEQISFKDYVSLAGGYSDNAKPGKAYIVYANGSAARTKKFLWFKNYPTPQPGAEIIVPKRPDRRKISIQEVLAITTSLTTIALLIDRLSTN